MFFFGKIMILHCGFVKIMGIFRIMIQNVSQSLTGGWGSFKKSSFETYDRVQFHYKLKDKNYKIYGLIGVIVFRDNIKDCFNKKDEIVSELSEVLKDTKKTTNDNGKHDADKSGKSKTHDVYFSFKSGNYISVSCYDWSEEMTKKNKWFDNLKVAIQTKEFEDFLIEYYK